MDKRLNGWKAIAAFFDRDRTTVARWARERDLPVHHIPGGKQRSVFAFEHELAAWARQHAAEVEAVDVPSVVEDPASLPPAVTAPRRWSWIVAAAFVSLVTFAAAYLLWPRQPAAPRPSPAHAAVMADYLAARDAWARRTPEDIATSIRMYESIIARAPDFAPARAGLAEAWLIYREYGDVGDAKAFATAKIAASKAATLDPQLPAAHRALGFISYWWDNEPADAVREFQQAIALDDRDSQTQFWYANVLADMGEAEAAERHYRQARLLAPGSQPIAVEHACAQWQAGRDDLALKLMTALKAEYPSDATIPNCLAWVHIGRGDIAAYARELGDSARLRGEPELLRLSRTLDAAVQADSATAHRVLIADNRREIAAGTRRIREVPAFYASSMGDRGELLALMREAALLGERWYSPGVTRRIAERWKDDREVTALLARLRIPPPDIPEIR
ncbi:MAG: tetratricopeptide repeat protein [Sphingomonadales bacterium]|nr:MAG: tetratricopeptide repeat protein [Sphingomonadales bacterium]